MADWAKAAADVFKPLPSLIVLLGFLAGILAVSSGVKDRLPIEGSMARGMLGGWGIVLIGIGIWLWRGNHAKRQPDRKKLSIKILNPMAGDRVDCVDVRGTMEKNSIPEGYVLRVLRGYPQVNGFVPQGATTVDEHEGIWQAVGIDIGGDPGDPRWIDVWLVGEDGRALLKYWEEANEVHFEVMRRLKAAGGKRDGLWLPPIVTKTRDMMLCARVNVVRK